MSGLAGQGLRFAMVGSLGAVVYLTSTTVLHTVLGVPFQIALGIGFCLTIAMHFTLQRLFVWRHPSGTFALPAHRQAGRYLLVSVAQYVTTALCTSCLPGLLNEPVEGVYVVTALVLMSINFVILRGRIFHPAGGAATAPPLPRSSFDGRPG